MSRIRRGETSWLRSGLTVSAALIVTFIGTDGFEAGNSGREDASRGRSVGPALAGADVDWGADQDMDGLLDDIERLIGVDSLMVDTDGDGYDDGVEWLMRSDAADAASVPDPRPAVRTLCHQSNGEIRVFCALYPANLQFIESFHLLVGSPDFDLATEGDPGVAIGLYDISGLLPALSGSYTLTQFLGLDVIGFDFGLDPSLLTPSTPLNVAVSARLAGVPVADQSYLGVQGSTSYVISGGPAIGGSSASYIANPLNPIPPPSDETPEYCAIGFSGGSPVGVASVEFSVTSAECEPDGLLYCIDVDCMALQGQSFMMVDYGYLQSKSSQ
jgi:hypothetical protein